MNKVNGAPPKTEKLFQNGGLQSLVRAVYRGGEENMARYNLLRKSLAMSVFQIIRYIRAEIKIVQNISGEIATY